MKGKFKWHTYSFKMYYFSFNKHEYTEEMQIEVYFRDIISNGKLD